MKPVTWVGIVLIVLGVLILAYQGINYTRQKKVLDVGSVHITTETHERLVKGGVKVGQCGGVKVSQWS